ncbi:MAG: purine-nucleoside phosphorylase [Ignavibacteria bacterium]|jgi:purine-nucleoside phosphorylase
MTEQKKKILSSVDNIKANFPFKKKCEIGVISYRDPYFLREFKIIRRFPFEKIPPDFEGDIAENKGEFLIVNAGSSAKNIIFLNGRFNAYNGYEMRDVAHPIYVLKELGIKTLILIDEVGYLNPRFEIGGISLIYDHINLMGDNPLIGENDDTLGTRFPDMSNAYDSKFYNTAEKVFINDKVKFFPSVYLGITGPETETEAECRFFREIGADVLGYSLIPENLAAVHAGMNVMAFGMISRELVADRLCEIPAGEQRENRERAEKAFSPLLKKIINSL